jgi:hypothetical protein
MSRKKCKISKNKKNDGKTVYPQENPKEHFSFWA